MVAYVLSSVFSELSEIASETVSYRKMKDARTAINTPIKNAIDWLCIETGGVPAYEIATALASGRAKVAEIFKDDL
jgi:hypothetical protein